MRIAICDDNEADLNMIASMIHSYDSSGLMTISLFSTATELYSQCQTKPVDIAVLDIEMKSPNGYEIARQLISQKKPPLIIFVTNSSAYTIRGYGVALRYLVKPLSKELLWEALDTALLKIKANRFAFSIDGGSYVINIEDIYYFEVFNHVAVVHTCDSEYTFRTSLKDVAAQLPTGCFGIPHQSYLVNLGHVKAAHSDKIILTNGAHVPVSRRKLKQFQEEFYGYLGRL